MLKHFHTKLDIKKLTTEGEFEGYGAVFNNVDLTGDKILPGAFANTLKEKNVGEIKMLYQHDPSLPVGRWTEMSEDKHGLFVKGQILTTIARGAEMLELLKAGVVDGLSIGFRTVKSMWEDGTDFRQLVDLDLWEISIVTFPANTKARVDAVKMTLREAEHVLREGGMPSDFAKLVAKYGFEEAQRRVGQDRRDGDLSGISFDWMNS